MEKEKPNPDEDVARTYFEIEPVTEAANPANLEHAFQRLHSRRRQPTQLECLLVARGDGIDYYIGTVEEQSRTVDHQLHSIFPDETSISNPDTDPRAILETLGPDDDPIDGDEGDDGDGGIDHHSDPDPAMPTSRRQTTCSATNPR
jgi:hypothetical protein